MQRRDYICAARFNVTRERGVRLKNVDRGGEFGGLMIFTLRCATHAEGCGISFVSSLLMWMCDCCKDFKSS